MSKRAKIKKTLMIVARWLVALAAVFFIAGSLLAAPYFIYEKIYRDKVYPGVYFGNTDLRGYTKEGLKNLFDRKIDKINQGGIVFHFGNNRAVLMPLISSVEGDLAYPIIDFGAEKTVNRIMDFGRQGNFYDNLRQRAAALIYRRKFHMEYTINNAELQNFLVNNFSRFSSPARDAALAYDKKRGDFTIVGEKYGRAINYGEAISRLGANLAVLDDSPLFLSDRTDLPRIHEKDCAGMEAEAEKISRLAPLTLSYGKNRWTLGRETLAGWLTLKEKNDLASSVPVMAIGLDRQSVADFLDKTIAPEINVKPVNARLEIKDGRVIEFMASRDGLELNTEASYQNIEYRLIEVGENLVELAVRDMKSAVQTETINDLGIKEIIGIGESNFSGSPQNRRHNIKTGAEALNGVLIKPDEEFSLVGALGEIDKEAGYLPELVIKGNRTVPEYGGGLCQIGTTMFRSALATGLPITMRRNHSYRVSYYEPAGTDATIYNPWPDMKFVNDTGRHILIQARIEGDNLYFDFWGTRDGRLVEKTEPTITNIVRPGPTQLIETLDLAPGEKKCTEKAHNGADAYFDYKVTYAAGEVKEKRFTSHYVPWREVCLIGVEKLSTDTATSSQEQMQP